MREEEKARTEDQVALEAEPGALFRDMELERKVWPHHCLPALTRWSSLCLSFPSDNGGERAYLTGLLRVLSELICAVCLAQGLPH